MPDQRGRVGPDDDLRSVVLEDGMEDLIQLPHAAMAAQRIVVEADPIEALHQVLTELLREDLIRVYRGVDARLDEPLPEEEALDLLKDPYWYSFHLPDDDPDNRLTYINVANIRPEAR
jgi:hypothetical protein